MMKRRAPFIVHTGSGSPPSKKRGPFNFCAFCGFETGYVDSFHAQYCNHCDSVEEIDPDKLKAQQEQERQLRESTYTIADGSAIYNPDTYTRSNIRHGKTITAIPSGAGRTISMKDAITDKLRFKDGRTREMDQIFKAQDEQMTARGRTILEDRVELKRSSNIKSSDELGAEKQGTVGLSGFGEYNPAAGRKTRLSF